MLLIDKQVMDKTMDSDLTMVTNNAFNTVLQCVQNSGLNFQIQVSPFSAVISVKKSLVKNRSGDPIMPSFPKNDESKNVFDMESVKIKRKYEDLLCKHASAMEQIKLLENSIITRDQTNLRMFPTADEERVEVSQTKCKNENKENLEIEKNKKLKKNTGDEVEVNLKDDEETTVDDGAFINSPQLHVSQPSGFVRSPVVCSICSHVMPDYSTQYFSGYKLLPACDTCLKRDHLEDQGPLPFSAFPSSEMPPSLLAHWIDPLKLSPSQAISSSVSFRSHCIKWPNPGGRLYTADDILTEMKELMKKWWT